MKFVNLGSGFYLKVDAIKAVEIVISELLDHTFLRIYTEETTFDFQGERAKKAWKNIQKIIEQV